MNDIIDADQSWVRDLQFILEYGNEVSPRGMLVRESVAYMSVLSMMDPIIHNPRRKLGYKFMAAEAAWILSGDDRVETIKPYSKDISKFSDDGVTFFGAYGPKIRSQMTYVMNAIDSDPDTRQAVLTIWRETPPSSRDIPCTVSLQWLVRSGNLHCVATMRSSDLWLGHPYDIFNFSAVSFALLIELNRLRNERGALPLTLGNLYLTAGSKHIYERNFEGVRDIVSSFRPEQRKFRSPFVGTDYYDVNDFVGALWDAANSSEGVKVLLGE